MLTHVGYRPRHTRGRVGRGNVGDVFSKDDGEASLEVEVDVAVEEPGAGVVSAEADRDVVARSTGANDVALRGVDIVVLRAASTAHDVESVLWKT